jgi:hypothetical protein
MGSVSEMEGCMYSVSKARSTRGIGLVECSLDLTGTEQRRGSTSQVLDGRETGLRSPACKKEWRTWDFPSRLWVHPMDAGSSCPARALRFRWLSV